MTDLVSNINIKRMTEEEKVCQDCGEDAGNTVPPITIVWEEGECDRCECEGRITDLQNFYESKP